MWRKIFLPVIVMSLLAAVRVCAQEQKVQQGMLLKSGTALRLGNIHVLNKHSGAATRSNTVGVFSITALPGDTLQFSDDNYLVHELVVTSLADAIIYLQPVIQLAEVVIKENSLAGELRETKLGYRKKSVFYTGTPHYYYLFLKPMTFIYENFKSEVIDARRFNRFARREMDAYEINKRFNNTLIRQVVPVSEAEVDDFRADYAPTQKQLDLMSDYDVINYIKDKYQHYIAKKKTTPPL